MIFYEKGEIVKCSNCGENLYYVNEDLDSNEKVFESIHKLSFIKPQKEVDKFTPRYDMKCHNCGEDFVEQMSLKANKETNNNYLLMESWRKLIHSIRNL